MHRRRCVHRPDVPHRVGAPRAGRVGGSRRAHTERALHSWHERPVQTNSRATRHSTSGTYRGGRLDRQRSRCYGRCRRRERSRGWCRRDASDPSARDRWRRARGGHSPSRRRVEYMRILFLSHRLPYAPNRGDRIRAHHLLRHLVLRHEVHVVSLVHDADEMARAVDLEPMVASVRVARVPRVRNLAAAIAALPGRTPLTHVMLHSAEIRRILEDVVRSSPPDLVIAYCSGMAAHAVAGPLRGIPFLLDMVDADSQKWADLSRVARWPKKWIYQREARCLEAFERMAMSQAIATTVVSEKELAALERIAQGAR